MSKRKVTLAINNIKRSIICLKQYSPKLFDKTFKTLGVYKPVYERLYSHKIYRLSDLENGLDVLDALYDYDGDKLTSLSRNIRNICKKHLAFNVTDAEIDLENEIVVSGGKYKPSPTKSKAKLQNHSPKKPTITSTFLRKFCNFYSAKNYSDDVFDNLCTWGAKIPGSRHHKIIDVKLKDGFVFKAYSEEERAFLRKLDKEKYIRIIRNGDFGIEVSQNGELLYTYYPDILIQTKDGKIGIIEVKPLYDLCDKSVKDKWEMLKQFCTENGYMCFIGNRVFNGYPELLKRPIPKALEDDVAFNLRKYNEFNFEDYKAYKRSSSLKGRQLDVALSALCVKKKYTYDINFYGLREFKIYRE